MVEMPVFYKDMGNKLFPLKKSKRFCPDIATYDANK